MNLPNKLTLLRIVLVPILALVWLFPYYLFDIEFISINIGPCSISILNLIVLFIFCVACITDFLDGYLARNSSRITTFGKFADPIADKLLINVSLIILCFKGLIPVVSVIIMIGRDVFVDGCRLIAAQNSEVISAGILGKAKTNLQMFAIIFSIINNFPFELWNLPVASLLVWFATFVSVLGGYSYYSQVKDMIFYSM